MTREEAKQVLIVKAGLGDFVENIIDQIYDDHDDIVHQMPFQGGLGNYTKKELEIKHLQAAGKL